MRSCRPRASNASPSGRSRDTQPGDTAATRCAGTTAAVDEGAHAVAYFWGLLTAGCLLGLVLLKLFDCRKVLIWFSAAAIVSLTCALVGGAQVAYYSFMLVGFFLSVMWSVIFSLALNSVAQHHGSFSGILCTGIVGGAVVSLLVGWLGERFGLRAGMTVLYLTLGYIMAIGIWAKPLVDNATVSLKELIGVFSPENFVPYRRESEVSL